jgi:hypothetical protein
VLFLALYRALFEVIRQGVIRARNEPELLRAVEVVDEWCSNALRGVVSSSQGALSDQWPKACDKLAYELAVEVSMPSLRGFRFLFIAYAPTPDPARDLAVSVQRTFGSILFGHNLRIPASDPEDFAELIKRLLTTDVRRALEKMVRMWGRGDASDYERRIQFIVEPGDTPESRGLAGLGIALALMDKVTGQEPIRIQLLWTPEARMREKRQKRRLSDYLLLTSCGIVHEFVCHGPDEDDRITGAGTEMHGWMAHLVLADELDRATRKGGTVGELRKLAVEPLLPRPGGRICPELIQAIPDEANGWVAAEALAKMLAAVDMQHIKCDPLPGCPRSGLTVYDTSHVLTRWAIRSRSGSSHVLCDLTGCSLEPGSECPRLRAVGESLAAQVQDLARAVCVVTAVERTLQIDLSHWKRHWYKGAA